MFHNTIHRALLLFTAASLTFAGCTEENIVSPERMPGEPGVAVGGSVALSKTGRGRPLSAVMKIDSDFFFGDITTADGVMHIRNQRPVGIITGEMVGAVDSEWSVDIVQAVGRGPAQGVFTFTVEELFGEPVKGAFVGGAVGEIQLPDPEVEGDYIRHPGELVALGTGDLEGMILMGSYVGQPPGFEGHDGPAFILSLGVQFSKHNPHRDEHGGRDGDVDDDRVDDGNEED